MNSHFSTAILAIHGSHREEIVLGMNTADLKTLAQWHGEQRG
jgi:hypothetical protein